MPNPENQQPVSGLIEEDKFIKKGMDRLEQKVAMEDSQPAPGPDDLEIDEPEVMQSGPPGAMASRVHLLPWPYDTSKVSKATVAVYFIRIYNPNDKNWHVVCSKLSDGILRPTVFFGTEEAFPMIENIKKSNPMMRVGWIRFNLKGEGE